MGVNNISPYIISDPGQGAIIFFCTQIFLLVFIYYFLNPIIQGLLIDAFDNQTKNHGHYTDQKDFVMTRKDFIDWIFRPIAKVKSDYEKYKKLMIKSKFEELEGKKDD